MSCNNMLEDRNNGGRSAETGNMNDHKVTTENYSWGISTEPDGLGDGEDLLGGFSWPPRSYTCTFCKREFRSAQALGGHMNVHRRDRARLRQMPSSRDLSLDPHSYPSNYSLLSLNLDQNPNPNRNFRPNPNPNISPYFSSTPTMFPSFTSTSKLPPLISSSPTSTQPNLPCQLRYSTTHPSNHLHRGSPNLTNIKSQIPLHKFHGFPNEKEGMIIKNSEIVRLNLEIGLIGESNSDDLDLELRLGCS